MRNKVAIIQKSHNYKKWSANCEIVSIVKNKSQMSEIKSQLSTKKLQCVKQSKLS